MGLLKDWQKMQLAKKAKQDAPDAPDVSGISAIWGQTILDIHKQNSAMSVALEKESARPPLGEWSTEEIFKFIEDKTAVGTRFKEIMAEIAGEIAAKDLTICRQADRVSLLTARVAQLEEDQKDMVRLPSGVRIGHTIRVPRPANMAVVSHGPEDAIAPVSTGLAFEEYVKTPTGFIQKPGDPPTTY